MKTPINTLRGILTLLALLLTASVSFALDVGDKAPLFGGHSTQGYIQLSEYLGKKNVVLALYFAVFTPV
jgi:hypothetical protein